MFPVEMWKQLGYGQLKNNEGLTYQRREVAVEVEDLKVRIDDALVDDGSTGHVVGGLASHLVLLGQGESGVVSFLYDDVGQLGGRPDDVLEGSTDSGNLNFLDGWELTFADTITEDDHIVGEVAVDLLVLHQQFGHHFVQLYHGLFAVLALHSNAGVVDGERSIVRSNGCGHR